MECIPDMKAAEDALNLIKKGDIEQLTGLEAPPADVMMVTSVICMFMGIKADNKNDEPTTGENWALSVKMMK